MWSDVARRVTVDLDTGKVVTDEKFTGDERPRTLSRALPQGVKNIETTLFYKPRPGHPDSGIPVHDQADRGANMDEDRRLFDRGLKRGHDGSGQHGNPQPKSKVGGVWIADVVTPWGDKRKYPVIANARDLQAFSKLVKTDVFYTYSELHSGWICLTKKSGKELQERTLTAQERKMFDEAKLTEIENLEGSSAISFVTDPEEIRKIKESFSHRIMPSRFILTKKQQELGQSWKAKARWILLGHRDPDAQELERYAPTPATPTVYLAFQILSSLRYELIIMDVSSAFGQSDQHERERGPLFATMPPSGIPGKGKDYIIRVLTAVYGLVNAPAIWRKTVRRVLAELGYQESTFDPCLYYLPFTAEENPTGKRGCAGLVLLDVDDFLQGGNLRHGALMEKLRGKFKFGKWRTVYKGSGEYLGRTVYQLDDYEIQVSMERYIHEKLRPVVLPREKIKDEERHLDEHETAGNLEGNKSQRGFLVAFADKSIMMGKTGRLSINSWKSHRFRRAVKSSLGSEALAMDDGLAELEWTKALFCEAVIPGTCVNDGTRYGEDETIAVVRVRDEDEGAAVTDARALYDLFHRRSGSAGLCRRAQLDVAVMSKSAELLRTTVHWLPGQYMIADCLTKRLGNSSLLRAVMETAEYGLTKSALETPWLSPLYGCGTKNNIPQSVPPKGL